MTQIAIIEEHQAALDGACAWLAIHASDIGVSVARTAWQAADGHEDQPFDVLVLGASHDGHPMRSKLASAHAQGIRVVVAGAGLNPAVVKQLLDAGAAAYVSKDEGFEALVSAVRVVAAGGTYVTEGATDAGATPVLTRQEARVTAVYASGLSTKEAAAALLIAEETFRSYLKKIRAKFRACGFGCDNRAMFRASALAVGIVVS